ncbi:hypothetical protein Tco_0291442 [Tanacetum coccineum]
MKGSSCQEQKQDSSSSLSDGCEECILVWPLMEMESQSLVAGVKAQTPKVLLLAWEKFLEIKHIEKQHHPEDIQDLLCKLLEDVRNVNEELAEYINTPSWNRPAFYFDDDDDEESSIPVRDIISELPLCVAITPDLPITDSLIMEDEHLDTIPETESDELIKSSVENLVPIPSESEDFSEIESECDVPVCDDFTTFSNLLFDSNDDFFSSYDESISDEDVPKKIYSNPLFDEEIISSPKSDSILEEFSGELAHINLIPPRINEADFDPEEEIRLVERLLYNNSSPRPPEEVNSKNSDVVIESFSPSPIPVEDIDSFMEEIDLFLTPDDSMPSGIENNDYDSEGDILFLEELLSNDSPSLPENEPFHFYVPSSPRPPAKPPDDGIYFEPDTGLLTIKGVGDISEHYVLMPRILPIKPTLASNEEKSPHLLSHRGFKATKLFHHKSPMLIHGDNTPNLGVRRPYLAYATTLLNNLVAQVDE